MEEFFLLSELNLEDMMAEYEIEIIDYLKLIWRKKWLIFFGTFLFVIITGAVTLVLPKTYVATAYLQIGKIGGRFIEEPMGLRARIETSHYGEMFIKNKGRSLLKKDLRLKTESSRVGVIRLTAEGPLREINGEFLRYVITDATSTHEKEYTDALQLKIEREELLVSQIAYLEERIAQMNDAVADSEARMRRGESGIFVFQGALIGMESQLSSLKDSYSNFKMREAVLESYETTLLSVEAPGSPVRPSLRLNVSVALFFGVLIFMAIALFLEYRKREEKPKEL